MLYRKLGQTGLSVSVIGFGASPLGDVFGMVSPRQGEAAVQHAIDSGINIFDVSPYYGLTLAEERLGQFVANRRHEIVLATKCGRYGADHFDFSAKTIIETFEASLQRLRTGYVDLLQVHDVEFGSLEQIVNETLPALRQLQQQGKARFVGITGYWPNLLADLARIVPVDTVLNYCHWNVLMDDMDRHLTPLAKQMGIGLLNASPLHMGLLGGGTVPEWHPAPPQVRKSAETVVGICQQHGVNPATVALYHCLTHPFVASTFMGFQSAAEVRGALQALDFVPSANLMDAINKVVRPLFNITWPSGLPENQPAERTYAH